MSTDSTTPNVNWRTELPPLCGALVTLREPTAADVAPLLDVLSIADASRFGLELPISEDALADFVERVRRERIAGLAFAYVVVANAADDRTRAATIAGLFHVRQLDPGFEAA